MPQGQGTYSHPHLSEYTGNQNQNNMSFMTGAGGAALGMIGGMIGAGHQHRRQRELMDQQMRNQMRLNQQGHQLQFDMWKKTSYPAQLEMMKQAGLSPGLMYGGGAGAGGSTGSQGGGSAAGGSAAAFQAMDLSNMMKIQAETDLIKAQENNVNKDTEKKGEEVKRTVAETAKTIADKLAVEQNMSESKQRELNLKTENDIKEWDRDYLKEHYMSTYDTSIVRTLKATGMSIGEALKYFEENGGLLKVLLGGKGTGKPDGSGGKIYRDGYMWNDRTNEWIKY